ncbi:MAG: Ppx/GppA family phosphatase [Acidimicrobiia bacterium]|nr:Ppx/GppA family phosphatase [Acidimicrobiia bacterium]
MPEIIPRWEWRTFGADLGKPEDIFTTVSPIGVHESDEIYFLSEMGANVKVRDGLMDIKVLREVNGDGLEQWVPVAKHQFPLGSREVAEVFDALAVDMPPLERETYSFDPFLDDLVVPSPDIRGVSVHKRRVRYSIDGCMAEFTDLTVNGFTTQTVAAESEDPDAVIGVVRELGFGGYLNTNYIAGLKATIAGAPARYAVIDVGTNSVKFHLGERARDGSWGTVIDRAELTRLGEDLEQDGVIIPEATRRTADAVAGMVAEAKEHGALAIAAVGTAGLRLATNRDSVVETIRARSGVTVEIISGEEESRLAYLAVVAGIDTGEGSAVVFDTGGGSSQFTFGTGSHVEDRFSVPVGAVRYTEQFGLDGSVSPDVLAEAMGAIAADLSSIDGRPIPDILVAMGGAVTNITAVSHSMATYDPDVVQGTVLSRAEVDRQIELYRSMDPSERRTIVGLQPKRAEVILAGACIVATVMDKLGQESLTVSDRGLRHGVLLERFGS